MVRGTARAVRFIKDNPVETQKTMDQLLAIRDAEVARNIYLLVAGLYSDKIVADTIIQSAINEEAQLGLQSVPPLADVIDWSFLRHADMK